MASDSSTWSAITPVASLAIAAWALFVGWRTFRATAKQAEVAERTRKSSIKPYVVAFTRQYAYQDPVYFMIANVGFGAAKDVRAHIIKGADFEPLEGKPLREWRPLKEPISILRVNERLWTILFFKLLTDVERFKNYDITVEITYSDIEGTTFGPEQFSLDLFPNDGVLAASSKRSVGSDVVEEKDFRPEDI